jgi:hypothetical protein
MFNRVKYIIIKNLKQTSKSKEKFVKNKKQYNLINKNLFNKNLFNKNLYNPIVVRKYHTMNNNQSSFNPQLPDDDDWIIIASLFVGSFYLSRKK